MTGDPVCCVPTDTVARIAKLMKTENIGSVPICEDRHGRKLLGIVTDRDELSGRPLNEEYPQIKEFFQIAIVVCGHSDDEKHSEYTIISLGWHPPVGHYASGYP